MKRLSIIILSFTTILFFTTSCSDFLYDESDQLIYAEDHDLTSDADTLWNMAGILNKMQAVADRTILLGELRGDLSVVTDNASSDLRELANFSIGATNQYNRARDYYAIINNCNFFLAKADTALRNNRNEPIFLKEYAAVKVFRAWTYLQLVLNYGKVPFITAPVLSQDESEKDFPLYDLKQVCQYFIADIAPYAETEMPGYGTIRNTNSKLFYYPAYVLLGDLNLWAGNYKAAAENYYKYISTRNGRNSAYPITTNSVRFARNDLRWMSMSDSWSASSFGELSEALNSGEVITVIPGDSLPSEGNYSQLPNLFSSTEGNEFKESIRPSQAIIDLSAAQKYCQLTTSGDYVSAPGNLTGYQKGDLRLQAVYTTAEGSSMMFNGKRIENYSVILKQSSRNVHILRRAMVYLRLAEALNRAGYPRFAFAILKTGVNNRVIENDIIPNYPPAEADFLRSFNFPNNDYVLETAAEQPTENTMGLHSRGCGYTAGNNDYVFPDDSTISDSLARQQYQMEQVENLIMDESALELAFEGQRFYDLMRVALRRNDPAYLANKVARRNGTTDATLQSLLMTTSNWYLKLNQ